MCVGIYIHIYIKINKAVATYLPKSNEMGSSEHRLLLWSLSPLQPDFKT